MSEAKSTSKKAEVNACGKGNWYLEKGKIMSKTKKGEIISCTDKDSPKGDKDK